MIVQKDKNMILSDSAAVNQLSSNSELDFSLCTNSVEMIDNLNRLCELLWKSAETLEAVDVKKHIKNKN
jgi:hypothetical protein